MLHSTLLSPTSPGSPLDEVFTAVDLSAVYAVACRLKAASLAGGTGDRPLLGKNIALLRSRPPEAQLSMLDRAALDLGARVAHVRLGSPIEPNGIQFRGLSQMLGRLYDAIDCASLMPAEVRQIERHAGVPVSDDLGSADHPARALADLMTLREHGCTPGPDTQIAFLGDPLARRAENFFELARAAGIRVRQFDHSGTMEGVEFAVDALDADRWVLHAPGGPIDAAGCSQNHRFVLQAMLLATMNAA
jgi:ornithine carbamoyltransferase